MKRVSEKLHSARGASMLLALLFLLVCLTVGAVVLTAASASAGRTGRTRQEQQNYLAVASAVELLKGDLEKARFTGAYDKVVTEHSKEEDTGLVDEEGNPIIEIKRWTTTDYRKNPSQTGVADSEVLAAFSADLAALYYQQTPADSEDDPGDMVYDLRFDADPEHRMPGVSGTLRVVREEYDGESRGRYTLVVYLATEDGTNGTTMSFAAYERDGVRDVTGDNPQITTIPTVVTWSAPVVEKGAVS